MAILKTEAIVLKTQDFRTSSVIATLYTRKFGKVQGLFKGKYKDYKKFSSPLEPYSLNEIIFYRGKRSNLHLVSYCNLLDNFMRARSSLEAIACASYLVELTDRIMPLEDKNAEIFNLLLESLARIPLLRQPFKIIPIFQIKILSLSGFKPHLDSCVACIKPVVSQTFFSNSYGGLLCNLCRIKDRMAHPVLRGTIASIIHIEKSDWDRILRLTLSLKINQELNNILNRFLDFHLDAPLKSQGFLRSVMK